MNIVKNTTNQEIVVMWDGTNHYFRPGQRKSFSQGVAEHIILEAKGLELEVEEKVSEGVDVEESPVEEIVEPTVEVEDVFSTRITKNGATQYLKNGKMISKAEYEAK